MAALVRVRNVGSVDFVDAYANKRYVVRAGEEIVVDGDAPCLWLGYPGLRDEPNRGVWTRRDQYRRLRGRYGWHVGLGMSEQDWEHLRPALEVYSMDGERVWMILDDPTGEQSRRSPLVEEEVITGGEEVDVLRERMERQEAELAALRRLIESREQTEEVAEEVSEDKPRKVPVGARARSRAASR